TTDSLELPLDTLERVELTLTFNQLNLFRDGQHYSRLSHFTAHVPLHRCEDITGMLRFAPNLISFEICFNDEFGTQFVNKAVGSLPRLRYLRSFSLMNLDQNIVLPVLHA